jgi:hypothetical protein
MLGFFPPVFGVLPRSCDPSGPGGPGTGGTSSAGDAGQGGSSAGQGGASAGDSADGGSSAGASGESGAGGDASASPDRVVEPLLGCVTGVSGKETPGVFNLIEPFYDVGQAEDQRWLTDWSGDGQTAVGVHTNPPYEEAFGAFFVRWRANGTWSLDAKVRVELGSFNETPTYLTNCDDRVRVYRGGTGWLSSNVNGLDVGFEEPGLFHDQLVLSEDGTAITFRTGIREQVRPWTEWHDVNGKESSLLLDTVYSLAADGLTAFGISSCYTVSCTYPKTLRWRPLEGFADISTTAPTPFVAADGESIVYNYNDTHLGIWRSGAVDIIDCVDACTAIAWSSRAQVLLVNRGDEFFLWTRPHGFRRVVDLIDVPPGVIVVPTGLSLDGWTVTGDAYTDAPYANFRATLKADAFR